MLHHHTLIFILATVLSCLAGYEIEDRRRNYNTNVNTNSNTNQIFGGYNGGSGRDVGKDRDRGMAYANLKKYDSPPKAGAGSGKDRGRLYVSPKYGLEAGSSGAGGLRIGRLGAGGPVAGGLGAGGPGAGGSGVGRLGAGNVKAGDLRGGSLEAGGLGAVGLGAGDYGAGDLIVGGAGDLGTGRIEFEDLGAAYEPMIDATGYGEEICDSGYNPDGNNNQLFRYDNDEEGNRRYFDRRPYGDGSGGWAGNVNNNANNNVIGSRYRRNKNWGPLRATYFVDREPTYITDLQPSYVTDRESTYVNDRQPNYLADRQSNYVTDRQPNYLADRQSNYVADRKQGYPVERLTIYPGELGIYPTTVHPDDDDYENGYLGSSMNSNVNYNYLTGRRSNVNSNANNNEIRFGGYEQGRVQDRYPTSPFYSGFDEEGYDPDRRQDWNRGYEGHGGLRSHGDHGGHKGHGGYATKRYRPGEFRPQPKYAVDDDEDFDDDENDDDNDYYFPSGSANVNSNVNSNSNTNIVSRRGNPRSRRSVNEPQKKSGHDERLSTKGTTEASVQSST